MSVLPTPSPHAPEPPALRRIGIANRGECAVRFMRSARTWAAARNRPVELVALYTSADRHAKFVREADDTICIDRPDASPVSSYLSVPHLVERLLAAGCDSVWPGWGFVAESPEFAVACEEAGLTFIGPPASAMRVAGNKLAAKHLAEEAGVPVIPWSGGAVTVDDGLARARDLGFPLVIKAAAGGGGRGIRLVEAPAEFPRALESAIREARAAFGDGTVYLDTLLGEARHIEVQVLADAHGNVRALGTRDCSVQRRQQKVIEEAPAPNLTAEQAQRIQEDARRLALACGYRSAGTVEFLLLPDGRHFFMEMNTRLQVEHTVTECVTGLDLVEAQLEVACGSRIEPGTWAPRGHAIEVRLNAEDPEDGFTPTPGTIRHLSFGQGPGLRLDSGFDVGDRTSADFDSNLAKVVATGATRAQALLRLRESLRRSRVVLEGGTTNLGLLCELLDQPELRAGPVTTRWLDRYVARRGAEASARPDEHLAAAAAVLWEYEEVRQGRLQRWLDAGAAVPSEIGELRLARHGAEAVASVSARGPGLYLLRWQGGASSLHHFRRIGSVEAEIDGVPAYRSVSGKAIWLTLADAAHRFERVHDGQVVSRVPGAVTALHAEVGEEVQVGQLLVTLETMKLEIAVVAPRAGTVSAHLAPVGTRVVTGQALVALGAAASPRTWVPIAPARSDTPHGGEAAGTLQAFLLGFEVAESEAITALSEASRDGLLDTISLVGTLAELSSESPENPGDLARRATALLGDPSASAEAPRVVSLVAQLLSPRVPKGGGARSAATDLCFRILQAGEALPERERVVSRVVRRLLVMERHLHRPAGRTRAREALLSLARALDGELPGAASAARRAATACLLDPHVVERRASEDANVDPELARFHAHFDLSAGRVDAGIASCRAVARELASDVRLVLLARAGNAEDAWESALFASLEALGTLRDLHHRRAPMSEVFVRGSGPLDLAVVQSLAVPVGDVSDLGPIRFHLVREVDGVAQQRFEWDVPTVPGASPVFIESHDVGAPIRPLGALERRALEAARLSAVDPYELVRVLTSGTDLPRGSFHELDLTSDGARLQRVEVAPGGNVANVIVGEVTNDIEPFREGLRRVLVIGDPTRHFGALGEPECRRLLAAFDHAETHGLPVEWVPVSSGARIAMDSGTENLDWTARVLARIVRFTQAGGVVNLVVDGLCVGAQSYWNAEATMLPHCRGALVMTRRGSMVLTGKKALEHAGSASGRDHAAIGGYKRVMGPNGEAHHFAADLVSAFRLLLRRYALTHVPAGESRPRPLAHRDHGARDLRAFPYPEHVAHGFTTVGEIFDPALNGARKRSFSIRSVMHALLDTDVEPLESWRDWRDAETAVVLHGTLGGNPVACIGIESHPLPRRGTAPPDGPPQWSAGTLFPLSALKVARALNAASGSYPAVVLANLSGFDGSPESMRERILEYGAELGRAVVNFRGPLLFCVVSRYHGGAYVVFSTALNPSLRAVALEGAFASVIGGGPAAAVVFTREVSRRAAADPAVRAAEHAAELHPGEASRAALEQARHDAHARARSALAAEFDNVHTVERALRVGSIDEIIRPEALRSSAVEWLQAELAVASNVLPLTRTSSAH